MGLFYSSAVYLFIVFPSWKRSCDGIREHEKSTLWKPTKEKSKESGYLIVMKTSYLTWGGRIYTPEGREEIERCVYIVQRSS